MLSLTVAVFVALITTLSTSVASRAIDYQWKRGRGSYFGEGDWCVCGTHIHLRLLKSASSGLASTACKLTQLRSESIVQGFLAGR